MATTCEERQPYERAGYTPYEALPSKLSHGDPPLSIDVGSDASAFAMTKEVLLNFPLSLVIQTGGGKVLTGNFTYAIKSGNNVIFRQWVELKFQLFAIPLAPGLVVLSWNPTGFGTVKTYEAAGYVLPSDGTGGLQAVDKDASLNEQGQYCFDLADSDDAFPEDANASIRAMWFSPPYAVQIPENATIEIEDEHWPGAVSSPATFRFAFKKVTVGLSAFLDDTGTLRMAQLANGSTNIWHREVRPQDGLDTTYRRAILVGTSHGLIAKSADNAMWLLARVESDKQARMWLSEDDFVTHRQVTWRDDKGVETVMEIFPPETKLLDMKALPSGAMGVLGQKGDELSFAVIEESKAPTIRRIGTGKGGQYAMSVVSGRSGDGLVVVASIDHQFESEDEFASAAREKTAETV